MAEFFFGNPDDLPPHLRQILGMRSEKEVEQARSSGFKLFRDHYAPSWGEVMDKLGSCKQFTSLGQQIAQHVVTCNNIECPLNHAGNVTFCDHGVFMKSVARMFEETDAVDPSEAQAILQLWVEKEEESVLSDPRYISFRSAYDGYVVLIGAWKASTKAPF